MGQDCSDRKGNLGSGGMKSPGTWYDNDFTKNHPNKLQPQREDSRAKAAVLGKNAATELLPRVPYWGEDLASEARASHAFPLEPRTTLYYESGP